MIIGEKLWHKGVTKDMGVLEIDYRHFYTYKDMPVNVYESLQNSANINPYQIAFVDNDENSYTFQEFLKLVDQMAYVLNHTYKIKHGQHVGLLLYTDITFCISFYAIAKLGAVCVPLPTKYRQQEVAALVDKAYLDLLIYDEDFKTWIRKDKYKTIELNHHYQRHALETYLNISEKYDMKNEGQLEDEIILMFTSGTTSQSKGVILKNYNVMHAIITYQRILEITPDDKTMIPIPIYHITGLVALLGLFVHSQGTIYLYRRYDARHILECIQKNNITFMHGSPTVFSKLLDYKDDFKELRSLRSLGCGSSYTPLTKMKEFHAWLPYTKFQVIYGMTETASPALICPYDNPTSIYATAAGLLIPGMQLKIIDENGHEVEPGEVGQIWIKGTNVTSRYYNLVSDAIDEDYWLDTGDMGYYNEDQYVFIVDRKKDMINRGGEKIWCKDVEEAINTHPMVKESAVVGIHSDIYGEVAGAVVIKKGKVSEEELKKYLKSELASFKIPEKIVFVDEIYKTQGLKVDKKRIRTLFDGD